MAKTPLYHYDYGITIKTGKGIHENAEGADVKMLNVMLVELQRDLDLEVASMSTFRPDDSDELQFIHKQILIVKSLLVDRQKFEINEIIIQQLCELAKFNADQQVVHVIGSPIWHWYETIDDIIFAKIAKLETEQAQEDDEAYRNTLRGIDTICNTPIDEHQMTIDFVGRLCNPAQ
jgi:hypothetical protein